MTIPVNRVPHPEEYLTPSVGSIHQVTSHPAHLTFLVYPLAYSLG